VQTFVRVPTFNGRRFASFNLDEYTDASGRYRISGLQPGAYLVAVPIVVSTMPGDVLSTFRSQGSTGPLTERFRSIVDELGFVFSGLGAQVEDRLVAMTSGEPAPLSWPAEPAGSRVFRSTFHPSAIVADDAKVVVLEAADVTGVDIMMRSMPAFRVSGTLATDGTPAAYVGVRLVATGMDLLRRDHDGNVAMTVTGSHGRFSFLGVPPGTYTVKAREFGEPHRAAPGMATTSRPLRSWAEARVLVESADTVLPELTLGSPLAVSGVVALDGATEISRSIQMEKLPMTLGVNALTPYWSPAGRSQPIARAGPFEIPIGTPGRFDLILSYGGEWFVSSVTLGGRDVTRGVLTVDRSLTDLRVTLSNRPAALSVGVLDRGGRPTSAEVAVFPADFEALGDVSARVRRSIRSPASGVVHVSDLPAGDYFVAAFPTSLASPALSSPQPTELPDLDVMKRLAPRASRVTLTAGTQRSVQVQVVDFQVR
jgi:hypothetical protein